MTEPLPCPFCGASPTVEPAKWPDDEWIAKCDNVLCSMWVVQTFAQPTKEAAIALWNQRS